MEHKPYHDIAIVKPALWTEAQRELNSSPRVDVGILACASQELEG